jgi:hypothetical protein
MCRGEQCAHALASTGSHASSVRLIIGYAGEGGSDISTVTLLKTGGAEDTLDSLLQTMAGYPDRVIYVLFRHEEVLDKSRIIKFGMIKVLSAAVPPVKRAQISTHRGFITALLEPYSEEWQIDSASELTSAALAERFQTNMGTKTRVVAGEAKKQEVGAYACSRQSHLRCRVERRPTQSRGTHSQCRSHSSPRGRRRAEGGGRRRAPRRWHRLGVRQVRRAGSGHTGRGHAGRNEGIIAARVPRSAEEQAAH